MRPAEPIPWLRRVRQAAAASRNLPYTVLGGLMLVSLLSRLLLILR
jgi:hypothetical protein